MTKKTSNDDVNVKSGTVIIAVYGAAWTYVGRVLLNDAGIATIGGVAGLLVLFSVAGLFE
jgi:hypothetical protein